MYLEYNHGTNVDKYNLTGKNVYIYVFLILLLTIIKLT